MSVSHPQLSEERRNNPKVYKQVCLCVDDSGDGSSNDGIGYSDGGDWRPQVRTEARPQRRPADAWTDSRDRSTQGPTDRQTDRQTNDQPTDGPTDVTDRPRDQPTVRRTSRPTKRPTARPVSPQEPRRIPMIRSGRVKPDPCSRRLAGPLWKSKDPFHQGSSEQNFRSQGKQYTSDLLRKGPRRPQDIKARGGWGLEVRFGSPWNALFPYPDHPQAPGRIPS